MAPEVLTRRLSGALLACVVLLGCGNAGDAGSEISVTWTIAPRAPVTGGRTLTRITLADTQRQPLHGADLQLEAHMSHPGMTPVVVEMTERGNGIYEATLQFSMAGDWTLVVTGELPDGRRITRHVEIAGVGPAG